MGAVDIVSKAVDTALKNPKMLIPTFIYALFFVLIEFALLYPAIRPLSASLNTTFNSTSGFNTTYNSTNSTHTNPFTSPKFMAIFAILKKLLGILAIIIVIALLTQPLLIGMYISMAQQVLSGSDVMLGKAFDVAKDNYLNILFAGILVFLIAVIGIIGIVIVGVILAMVLSGLGIALALLIAIIAVLAFYICTYALYPVVVLENSGPMNALKRSTNIGWPNKMTVLGILLLIIALVIAVIIVEIILDIIISFIPVIGHVATVLVNLVVSAFISIFVYTAIVLFYMQYGKPPAAKPSPSKPVKKAKK